MELGIFPTEMRVTGGAARSETWMQIQADVVNIPVIRTEMEEATALGAAMLACKGVGIHDSLVKAADQMVKPLDPLRPNETNRTIYDEGYNRFRYLYDSLASMKWTSDE